MPVTNAEVYLRSRQEQPLPRPAVEYRTPHEQALWLVRAARFNRLRVALAKRSGSLDKLIPKAKAEIELDMQQHYDTQPTNE